MKPTRKGKSKPTTLMGRLRSNTIGQTTVEYLLMLMMVVVVALKFKGQISGLMQQWTTTLGGKVNASMESIETQ